ncbi:hypothetical protein D9757_006226 [Collybiopsis confluens]|uniref:chitin deacetylase n=1 Tax=Collybiopsis confluens TaxID=2823264 RepID=A0A8H5M8E8_9AGAR|nr:hypothetical protein D9757_006226 [Collybiopsis confluens]
MTGKKRASPGADDEKNPLIEGVELGEEDAAKLTEIRKSQSRAEILLERNAQKHLLPLYEKRRPVLKSINRFWPVALMNHSMFSFHAQHNADQVALSYLEDLWIVRDPVESRCFTIEFHFKENPHFTNSVLKKEYKWVPPPAAAAGKPDADGLTESMLDFSWERDVKPSSMTIEWKDSEKALTKLYPREKGEEEDDVPAESGSFFNYFLHDDDPYEIGLSISNELYPDAIDYFLGEAGGDEMDSDDEEDDDDDADEIDLEQPKPKKRKNIQRHHHRKAPGRPVPFSLVPPSPPMLAGLVVLSTLSLAVNGQSSSSSSSSAAAAAGSSVSSSSAAASTHTGTQATALTFSLATTNPTAVPLASITANETTFATIPLPSTATPGATNTFISGAPALPDASSIVSSSYPTWDKVPPTDSPEVQAWIAEVNATGLVIPQLSQTSLGGCPNNTAAAADTTRCWWYCTGCTRETDVQTCPTKLTWGLTYDDGPSFYTPNLLTYLTENNLHATFFTVGSRCAEFPTILQEEYIAGHQIAVHTWSHPYLTSLTNEEIIAELGWTKKIIQDILGVTPSYMRPPYGDIDDRVRNISVAMGLTPVMWTRMSPTATFDTDDFDVHGGLSSSYGVLNNWENIIANASEIDTGFIVLEHDLFEESVQLATGYILPSAMQQKFDIKPVVECLNLPMSDAYIETNDNASHAPLVTQTAAASGSSGTSGTSSGSTKNGGVTLTVPGASWAVLLSCISASIALFL